ncbi:MAG: hypothetical protein FWG68_04560 [Defluviitaleaceae bacterium]|nr:hypothetical protein [Defluviitaleaceae bacterium]
MNIGNTSPKKLWYMEWQVAQSLKEDDKILNFSKAVDEWKNQILSRGTALTEEEKEQIRALIARWLEENPLETDEDKAKFRAFVQEVYEKFGAKHDTAYLLGETIMSVLDERTNLTHFMRDTLLEVLNMLKNPASMKSPANRENQANEIAQNIAVMASSKLYPVQVRLFNENV